MVVGNSWLKGRGFGGGICIPALCASPAAGGKTSHSGFVFMKVSADKVQPFPFFKDNTSREPEILSPDEVVVRVDAQARQVCILSVLVRKTMRVLIKRDAQCRAHLVVCGL